MAGSKSKLTLFIDRIADAFVRDNFLKLKDFLTKEPFLNGDWKFFEARPTKEATFEYFKIPHNLNFTPKDFIMLSKRIGMGGDIKFAPDVSGYYRPYADSKFVYLAVESPKLVFSAAGHERTGAFDTLTGFPISVAVIVDGTNITENPFVKEGDIVYFTPGPGSIGAFPPDPLLTSFPYYVKYDPIVNGGPLYFQLSTTPGGASILSPSGTGASIPSGQTLLCKPTEFKSSVRFIAGAINDL